MMHSNMPETVVYIIYSTVIRRFIRNVFFYGWMDDLLMKDGLMVS